MWRNGGIVTNVEGNPVAVMAQHNAPAGPRHRILIILAAAWIAVSLAIGGWVMPDDDGGPPAQAAAAREAAQP
jgi:hypothetical protein